MNTYDSENIPILPQFQALYIMPMPCFRAPKCPFFEDANVIKFLERYKNICKNHQNFIIEKICHLPLYDKMFTTRYVKSVISFWDQTGKRLSRS